MRSVLFTCLLLLSSPRITAQVSNAVTLPIAANSQKVTYTEQIPIQGVRRAELYARAKRWLVHSPALVRSTALTHAVLVKEQPEFGVLLTRATMTIPLLHAGALLEQPIEYTIAILARDGSYQYLLSDYQVLAGGKRLPLEAQLTPARRQDPQYASLVRQVETLVSRQSTQVIIALQGALRQPVAGAKKADPRAPFNLEVPRAKSPQR
jgi:hypothetical protein